MYLFFVISFRGASENKVSGSLSIGLLKIRFCLFIVLLCLLFQLFSGASSIDGDTPLDTILKQLHCMALRLARRRYSFFLSPFTDQYTSYNQLHVLMLVSSSLTNQIPLPSLTSYTYPHHIDPVLSHPQPL